MPKKFDQKIPLLPDFGSILLEVMSNKECGNYDDVVKLLGYYIFQDIFDHDEKYYDAFHTAIQEKDVLKEKFDHVIKFYYSNCRKQEIIDSIPNNLQFLGVFSAIEYLMIDDYQTFFDWLLSKVKEGSIEEFDDSALLALGEKHRKEFGMNHVLKKFFNAYTADHLEDLLNAIRVYDKGKEDFRNPSLDELIKFFVDLRNAVIHNAHSVPLRMRRDFDLAAQGYTHFSIETLDHINEKSYAIDQAAINMDSFFWVFERGLVNYFDQNLQYSSIPEKQQ